MNTKKSTNRIFAACVCVAITLVYMFVASIASQWRQPDSDMDLLVNDAPRLADDAKTVPIFSKNPGRESGMYASSQSAEGNAEKRSEWSNGLPVEPLPQLEDFSSDVVEGGGYPLESDPQMFIDHAPYDLAEPTGSPVEDDPELRFESRAQGVVQANQSQVPQMLGQPQNTVQAEQSWQAANQTAPSQNAGSNSILVMEAKVASRQNDGREWESRSTLPEIEPLLDQERPNQEQSVDQDNSEAPQRNSVPSFLPRAVGQNNLTAKPGPSIAEAPKGPPAVQPAGAPSPDPKKTKTQDSNSLSPSNFRLAAQPQEGKSFHEHHPVTDRRGWLVDSHESDFHPGPVYEGLPYDPYGQMDVYEGKTLHATQRPLLEIGRPWYQLGQLPESYDFLGKHNPVSPQLVVFGDMRTAYASNNNVNGSDSLVAFEWNMNWDLRLTGTERFAWFLAPVNDGQSNTRIELDNDRYVDEWNPDVLFGYFEGDLGAIVGGWTGQTLPFDLPFAVGVMPLLFQNGVWLEDQFLGVAATIPARNSPKLGISNMDVTFFAGYDEILSPAFNNEDDVAKLYGIASFIEASNGYWEVDYAYLEDRNSGRDRSYHNIGVGYSRRYGRWISNSTRVIVNAGQSIDGGLNTADGVVLLSENSLITAHPSTIIPYFNFFAGFDRPQKAAGQDLLRNTGILFESDGMTGYPTLDPSAQNTFGGAIGVNMMPNDFSQQLILETAFLGVMGDRADRNAVADQYGVGMRYQLPLNNSVILRADAMYGFLRDSEDINGVRIEMRRKF